MWSLSFLVMLVVSQNPDDDPDLRCGSYCLYVSLKALDFPIPSFDEIEEQLDQPQAIGYSLAEIDEVARGYGAHTLGVITTIENLRRRSGRFACIAQIDEAHFVNIAKIVEGQATLIDPPRSYTIPLWKLRARWDGTALLISPEPLLREEELAGRLPLWAACGVGGGVLLVGIGISLLRGRRTRNP